MVVRTVSSPGENLLGTLGRMPGGVRPCYDLTWFPMEGEQILIAVEIPFVGDERHKHWAKVVHDVDATKSSGWAFEGDFIAVGGIQDVPINSVVLVYGERGSRANPQIEARVFVANADGTLTPQASAKGRAWARTLRDPVEALLADQAERAIELVEWSPELMRFSDAALLEELERRNRDTEGLRPPSASP